MPLTIDGQANSIASSVGGVNIPATVGTLSVGPSGSYMRVTSSGTNIGPNGSYITANSSGIGIGTDNPTKLIDMSGVHSGINTTGRFVMGPHSAGWDLGVTSGNIAPHYQTNFTLYTGQIGSGTLRFNVDSSGRVTKPYQPAFWITDFIWSASTQRAHNAGNVWSNVGSHFNNSNGIFTAPVSGYYLFICTVQGHAPGEIAGRNVTYYNLNANKNGSNLGNEIVATIQESSGGKHDSITHQAIINLAVNDTFYFNSSYGFRGTQNSYVGYLLG
jgi:hypothetical protein